jgi:DNA repair exonuclease SbcCD ATPase subunit
MSSRNRLAWIELEAFRGFAETQRLDLDADVVLIRGDNGSGKTSLIDGFLWLVCGDLEHLAQRVKGLRKTHDPVVNRYAGEPARVRIAVMADGEELQFERSGNSVRSQLVGWRDQIPLDNAGAALADAFGDLDKEQLPTAVRTWGVLRQDAVLAALESGGALHERLSAVVGLERVTLFATSASKVAKDLRREKSRLEKLREDLRKRHEESQRLLSTSKRDQGERDAEPTSQLFPKSASLIEDSLPDGIRLSQSLTADPRTLTRLGVEVAALVNLATATAERNAAATARSTGVTTSLRELEAQLVELEARAKEATSRAPVTSQLASAALELLGELCPVCGQTIDQMSVRGHLTELLGESQAAMKSAGEAQQAVARAQAQVSEAKSAEDRRKEAADIVKRSVDAFRQRLQSVPELLIEDPWLEPGRAEELASVLEALRKQLRSLYADIGRSGGGVVLRAARDVETLASELRKIEADLEEVEGRCSRADSLDKASHAAAERIVERALRNLEPSFAEVFDRLAPHPTFTELRATQDIYYKKNQIVPEVYDPERRVSGNPLLVYSEGQLNVVALSYFLGLALNAREAALPFMLLDDPLQAMDVLSVLGFADLCRRVREHRQLVLTTHDRRFADVLTRKLAPREAGSRTLLHEFSGWTREGPIVKSHDAPEAQVIPLLRANSS